MAFIDEHLSSLTPLLNSPTTTTDLEQVYFSTDNTRKITYNRA